MACKYSERHQGPIQPQESPTSLETEEKLDRELKTYTCSFGPQQNSETIRWRALEKKENFCTYVHRVVKEASEKTVEN